MKSPVMPSNLPPLPAEKNGKPLVYYRIEKGSTLREASGAASCFMPDIGRWACQGSARFAYDQRDGVEHFATESNSAFCRLNGWGDFEEPEVPPTRLEAYREAIRKELEESERMSKEADAVAAAWRTRLVQCVEAHAALTNPPDAALSRKAWFDHGKKVERLHGKSPTNFPLWPHDAATTKTMKE